MAKNDNTIDDEDGNSSDWIEVFNNSSITVNLDGWHLTDDSDELTKWRFPAVSIEPDSYLLVFASDKDRTDPNSELHANFRLAAEEDYLALVEPDGISISHEFRPSFPEQFSDVSYGLEQIMLNTTLVPEGASASVWIPTSSAQDVPTATWTSISFNDSAWSSHNLGVGFDGGGELLTEISANGDLSATLRETTASAYVRTEFDLANADLDQLLLDVNFDDGFIAYLNGVDVARRNAPDTPNWSSTATQQNDLELSSVSFTSFSDEAVRDLFRLNGYTEFAGDRLQVTRSTANQVGSAWLRAPLSFSDYSFRAEFTLDVAAPFGVDELEPADSDGVGGQGMAFVLQSGGENRLGGPLGGLGLTNMGAAFVAVEFDTIATGDFDEGDMLPTHIGINTSAEGSLARVAVERFNGGAVGENLRFVWIEYNGVTQDLDVYFSAVDIQPASPTLTANVDLAGLFASTPELWPGFTAATSFQWNSHDVLDFSMSTFSTDPGVIAESIDISQHVDVLQTGTNVLAIHGLNLHATDDDFLVNATLKGTKEHFTVVENSAYFLLPTPGELNGEPGDPPSGGVQISVSSRTFTDPFSVTITPDTAGATIRYSTDGMMPTISSPEYTGPVSVSDTTQLRARAFEEGKGPGPVTTESFVLMDPTVSSFEGSIFESNLPIIVLESFADSGAEIDSRRFHSVSMMVFEPGTAGVASLANQPDLAVRGGLRRRGQSSQGFAKGQFALETWNETIDYSGAIDGKDGPDMAVSLLGMPAESDWVIQGPFADKTQLNNYLAFNLYRELDRSASRVQFAEVFLNSNGGPVDMQTDYRGTHIILEKIKIDANRVDNDDPIGNPVIGQDPSTVGGYIFKVDKAGAGDVVFSTAGRSVPAFTLRFHDPDAPNRAQQRYLSWFINEFDAALASPNWTDPIEGYAKYIDVDSWIDHWLITELAKEIDGFRISEYFFLNREGKIEKGPAWDFNLSFSNANYLNGGIWQGFYSGPFGSVSHGFHWYPRLFQDPAFESRVQERWFELRQDIFSRESIFQTIDIGVNRLTNGSLDYDTPPSGQSNPISRNYDRWHVIDDYLWPNCFFSEGGTCRRNPLPPGTGKPTENNAPNSYDDYIFIMKDFIEHRLTWIDGQFGAVMGDFDFDGTLDADDIDLIFDAINVSSTEPRFDMDGIPGLDHGDAEYLIETVIGTSYGDANLDLVVDGIDFGSMSIHLFEQTTGWATGDFNGSGSTDLLDFNLWNQHKWLVGSTGEAQPFRTPRAAVPNALRPSAHVGGELLLSTGNPSDLPSQTEPSQHAHISPSPNLVDGFVTGASQRYLPWQPTRLVAWHSTIRNESPTATTEADAAEAVDAAFSEVGSSIFHRRNRKPV